MMMGMKYFVFSVVSVGLVMAAPRAQALYARDGAEDGTAISIPGGKGWE